jgi:hypothetical protein
MTINFALSLSPEGIELLHRVQRGWRKIGRADVTSETLDADLTHMRQKAEAIEPGNLRTKLIIPLDQIKYTAIDSTMTTLDDIHAVLEGATPYALDELVIDCERLGGRTHIAAVARETLKEAEAFARAHGFNPVAFVAVPEPFTFQKEVFFGPSDMMPDLLGADAEVTADSLPVMIVGTRLKSRLLVFDLPDDVTPDDDQDDLAELLAPKVQDPAPRLEYVPDPVPEEPVVESMAEDIVEDVAVEPAPIEIEDPVQNQPIWVDLVVAEYHAPVVAPVLPEVIAPVVQLIPNAPKFAKLPLLDATIPEYHPSQRKKAKTPLTAAANAGSAKAPKLAAVAPAANRAVAPSPAAARSKTPLIAASVALAAVLLGGLVWSQREAAPVVDAEVVAEPITATPEPTVEVADAPLEAGPDIAPLAVTEFGTADTDGGTMPLVATESAGPTVFTPDVFAATNADDAPGPVMPPPAPPALETAQATVGAPVLRGQVLSPADAMQIYEATGVWQRAPRFFDVPTGNIPLVFTPPATLPSADRVAQPDVPLLEGLETDLSFIAPANPPSPDEVFPRGADGFILATPEGTLTPEGALVIAGLPDLNINLRPTLQQSDLDRMALLAPAPEGVVIIAGAPDFVTRLRPADAQLPEVAEPNVASDTAPTQTLTPGSVGVAALELQNSGALALDPSTVEGNAENDLRPQLRPSGLSAVLDNATPDITAIIAGIEAEEATLRFDNSTALAVVASRRPAVRPSNFGTVVANARARLTSAAPAPTPQAAAPAAPQVAAAPVAPQNFAPVPGGVARAATIEGAIRLRDINLIGVYGRANARRALVRLSNGRYVRVEVGSALDGGQVTAIGEDALNYVKRGRTYAIGLPG